MDFEPIVARLFSVCNDPMKLGHAVQMLVERYLSVELLFAERANEDAVIADLIKAHKDNLEVRRHGRLSLYWRLRLPRVTKCDNSALFNDPRSTPTEHLVPPKSAPFVFGAILGVQGVVLGIYNP